ncbi:MAG: hypothetical protein IPH82_12545 [Chloroflexi bacterium]|nr:hypothetical protein [Chloroflexota bacterium]
MSDVPCVPIPNAKTITIPLPMGIELRSLTDISQGPPSDCALAHSLMLQVSPMLASMTCILKMLKVFSALKDTITDSPPFFDITSIGKLITALADLSSCFLLIDPVQICKMVKGILAIILSYIGCLIEAFESIWNFQLGIDLNAAQGNPVLLASLSCAQTNAENFHDQPDAVHGRCTAAHRHGQHPDGIYRRKTHRTQPHGHTFPQRPG